VGDAKAIARRSRQQDGRNPITGWGRLIKWSKTLSREGDLNIDPRETQDREKERRCSCNMLMMFDDEESQENTVRRKN
jgi:hypothetical protein